MSFNPVKTLGHSWILSFRDWGMLWAVRQQECGGSAGLQAWAWVSERSKIFGKYMTIRVYVCACARVRVCISILFVVLFWYAKNASLGFINPKNFWSNPKNLTRAFHQVSSDRRGGKVDPSLPPPSFIPCPSLCSGGPRLPARSAPMGIRSSPSSPRRTTKTQHVW